MSKRRDKKIARSVSGTIVTPGAGMQHMLQTKQFGIKGDYDPAPMDKAWSENWRIGDRTGRT